MGKFSIGLDLGSHKTTLAVFNHEKRCEMPMEIAGQKSLISTIAVDPTSGQIGAVGHMAEKVSSRKSCGVLCAHRDIMYGAMEDMSEQRALCQERWHFDIAEQASIAESRTDTHYLLSGGKQVSLEFLIGKLVETACNALLEAKQPGGVLMSENGAETEFVNFCLSVPQCFTEKHQKLVSRSASEAIRRCLGEIPVIVVEESLAFALQFCSTPPYRARKFICVDLGFSKCTTSLCELTPSSSSHFTLHQLSSLTDVFVGASEIEFRVMKWCAQQLPNSTALLASKRVLYKLRGEARAAIKTLTVADEALIDASDIVSGADFELTLTLKTFNDICEDVFDTVSSMVRNVVGEHCLDGATEVVVAGGGMRIPRVQQKICKLLAPYGAKLVKTVDMDKTVALGTALLAALHCTEKLLQLPLNPQQAYVTVQTQVSPFARHKFAGWDDPMLARHVSEADTTARQASPRTSVGSLHASPSATDGGARSRGGDPALRCGECQASMARAWYVSASKGPMCEPCGRRRAMCAKCEQPHEGQYHKSKDGKVCNACWEKGLPKCCACRRPMDSRFWNTAMGSMCDACYQRNPPNVFHFGQTFQPSNSPASTPTARSSRGFFGLGRTSSPSRRQRSQSVVPAGPSSPVPSSASGRTEPARRVARTVRAASAALLGFRHTVSSPQVESSQAPALLYQDSQGSGSASGSGSETASVQSPQRGLSERF